MTDSRRQIVTLSNGMRAAVVQSDGNVAYAGVLVDAGSRDESIPGLAHFVEHTIFKGTRKRSSWHISNRLETVGGELNAYTSKENTSVYSIAPAGYEERSLELLADLIENATFPTAEIDREREVIIEEINSYLDNPAESVFDGFEELIYTGSAISHNILGTPDTVRGIQSEDCRGFIEKYYNPANMVAFVSTPSSPDRMKRLLEKYLGRLDRKGVTPLRETPSAALPFKEIRDKEGHQAHTILGTRIFGRRDPRRYALSLLNNYLGGPCMNSRLNQELREKRGLVYTVDSIMGLLSDAGAFVIYFGTDRQGVDKCRRIIERELDRLAQSTLSPRKFDKIREQFCGQLLIGSDNRESMAMSLGKNLLFYGNLTDVPAMAARIRQVTAEEMRAMAEFILSSGLSQLTLM